MSEQMPGLGQELDQGISTARNAVQEAGFTRPPTEYGPQGDRISLESIGTDSVLDPAIQVGRRNGEVDRVIAVTSTDTGEDFKGGTKSNYRAEINTTDQDGFSDVTVQRHNRETGEKYEHTFKNKETAQKFGALIAKQVARRADVISEEKRAA